MNGFTRKELMAFFRSVLERAVEEAPDDGKRVLARSGLEAFDLTCKLADIAENQSVGPAIKNANCHNLRCLVCEDTGMADAGKGDGTTKLCDCVIKQLESDFRLIGEHIEKPE